MAEERLVMQEDPVMLTAPAAIGIAVHYGRASAVSVVRSGDGHKVVDRRHLALAAPGLPLAPYHHEALELDPVEGESLVVRVRAAVTERARETLRTLRGDLAAVSIDVVALAIRESRPLPASFADVLASRARYVADSEIYRDAVHDAALELGLSVCLYANGEEFEFAADATHEPPSLVAKRMRQWRKTLGSPWQKDHQLAAAAAIGALARLVECREPHL